jgi:hypothetical protein
MQLRLSIASCDNDIGLYKSLAKMAPQDLAFANSYSVAKKAALETFIDWVKRFSLLCLLPVSTVFARG